MMILKVGMMDGMQLVVETIIIIDLLAMGKSFLEVIKIAETNMVIWLKHTMFHPKDFIGLKWTIFMLIHGMVANGVVFE